MSKVIIKLADIEFIVGQEYEFSDVLQSEKEFKVEWVKGVLGGYCPHPYSANSFVSDTNQCFYYCRHINPLNDAIDHINYLIMHKYRMQNNIKDDLKGIVKMITLTTS